MDNQTFYYASSEQWKMLSQAREWQNEQFAHPGDEHVLQQLRKVFLNERTSREIEGNIDMQFGKYLRDSITVYQATFPRVFQISVYCAAMLKIGIPYTVVGKGMPNTFNAFTLGTDMFAYLVLSPRLTVELGDAELAFVIGHECGHISLNHVMYQTIIELRLNYPQILEAGVGLLGTLGLRSAQKAGTVLLRKWQQRSEISADRAGLLCCQNLPAAENALMSTLTVNGHNTQMNIDEYLLNHQMQSKIERRNHLLDKHPSLVKRLLCLRVFANSGVYQRLTNSELSSKVLYSTSEMNQLVNDIMANDA